MRLQHCQFREFSTNAKSAKIAGAQYVAAILLTKPALHGTFLSLQKYQCNHYEGQDRSFERQWHTHITAAFKWMKQRDEGLMAFCSSLVMNDANAASRRWGRQIFICRSIPSIGQQLTCGYFQSNLKWIESRQNWWHTTLLSRMLSSRHSLQLSRDTHRKVQMVVTPWKWKNTIEWLLSQFMVCTLKHRHHRCTARKDMGPTTTCGTSRTFAIHKVCLYSIWLCRQRHM